MKNPKSYRFQKKLPEKITKFSTNKQTNKFGCFPFYLYLFYYGCSLENLP